MMNLTPQSSSNLTKVSLSEKDKKLLFDHLNEQQRAGQYHLSLGMTVVVFSWIWYFALPGIGGLIWAIIISLGVWVYPYIFFKKVKQLKASLATDQKIMLKNCLIEQKRKVAISRLHHEFRIRLQGKEYQVSAYQFMSLVANRRIDAEVVEQAGVLLSYKLRD